MLQRSLENGLCVLRLDRPPVNALSFELLDRLVDEVARAEADAAVAAIVVCGAGGTFSAGADLALFNQIATPADARELSRRFQAAFERIESATKPVVAALTGQAMGGALELAMACHRRIASPGSRLSVPEIKLAIFPAAGGVQRLPRLVGVPAAVDLLFTGRAVVAQKALEMGLIDAVVDEAGLLAAAAAQPAIVQTSQRRDRLGGDVSAELDAADARAAELPAEVIAPRALLAAMRRGLLHAHAAGLQAEQEGFAACMATSAPRHRLHLFAATRATARLPELEAIAAAAPRRVAVVGLGTMGSGIAQAFAQSGFDVQVVEQDPARLAAGIDAIRTAARRRVGRGGVSSADAEAMLARIAPADWDALAEVDLAVESVFESLEVKRGVLRRLATACPPRAILATNTSTFTLESLAADLPAERLVGLHFFNPAQRMPLVEVVRGEATAPATLAAALAVTKRLQKTPVVVASRPGFVVNRLFIPYAVEAFWLLEEGAAAEAIDRAAVAFGFPMGPLALIDMAGVDILLHTFDVLAAAFPRYGALPATVGRLVAAGRLGQKTGGGVYDYAAGDPTPRPSGYELALPAAAGSPPSAAAIRQRLVLRMLGEALHVRAEGVARGDDDLDVASVLGIGFPDYRGGVWRHALEWGPQRLALRLRGLAERHGERFLPP